MSDPGSALADAAPRVTMVKKLLKNGEPCEKCRQAEDLLRKRGLWERIECVVWAKEGDPESAGMKLSAEYGVELAPFFIVESPGEPARIHTSVLSFIKKELSSSETRAEAATDPLDFEALSTRLGALPPEDAVRWALERYGERCAIAFSGAEDVALIDMASRIGARFSVLTLDTGRLHPETYRFFDKVRDHYAIELTVMSPDTVRVEDLVRTKGFFSFYRDGHQECCSIRKVEPLRRALSHFEAWMTGQRRDQSPTRADVAVIETDAAHGQSDYPLVKLNPLANWSLSQVWTYLREHDVPVNELHERGYVSIGCEPCTRAVRPGEHERAGRWWWEAETQRECGLHVKK